MNWRRFFWASATCLLLISIVLYIKPDGSTLSANALPAPVTGFSMQNIQMQQTNDHGQPQFILLAGGIQALPEPNQFALEKIELRFLNADDAEQPAPWQVMATFGHLNKATQQLKLNDDVQIHAYSATPSTTTPSMHLSAQQLIIDLQQRTALSEQTVYIEQPPHKIEAGTLQADFNQDTLNLSQGIKAQFLPAS